MQVVKSIQVLRTPAFFSPRQMPSRNVVCCNRFCTPSHSPEAKSTSLTSCLRSQESEDPKTEVSMTRSIFTLSVHEPLTLTEYYTETNQTCFSLKERSKNGKVKTRNVTDNKHTQRKREKKELKDKRRNAKERRKDL